MPPRAVKKAAGPGTKQTARGRGTPKVAAQPPPEPEVVVEPVKAEEVKEEVMIETLSVEVVEEKNYEEDEDDKVEDMLVEDELDPAKNEEDEVKESAEEYENGERLDLEDNDPEEYEPEEYGGVDYDEKEIEQEDVQKEVDELEEEAEDGDVAEEEEGDMAEKEICNFYDQAKVRARLSRPLQRGRGKLAPRGDLRPGRAPAGGFRSPWARPIPRSLPVRGVRRVGGRLPPIVDRGLKRRPPGDSEAHEFQEANKSNHDGSTKGAVLGKRMKLQEGEKGKKAGQNDHVFLKKSWSLIARVIWLVQEGFDIIHWDWWERALLGHRKEFNDFKISVFKSMAWFIWVLYNKDFSGFDQIHIPLHQYSLPYDENDMEKYIEGVINGEGEWNEEHSLKEKAIKQHLLMELNEVKCFCIVDALYMEFWKLIPLESLKNTSISTELLEFLASYIHDVVYAMVRTRIRRLHHDVSLVKQKLSSFGSLDADVHYLIERADLERRTQGHSFISMDDILTSLRQSMLGDSLPCRSVEFKNSMYSDEDIVYDLFRRSKVIAKVHGKKSIELEHLYQALIDSNIVQITWKDFLKWVNSTKRKYQQKDAGINLWEYVNDNTDGKTIRGIEGSTVAAVEKMKNLLFFPLKLAKDAVNQKRIPLDSSEPFVLRMEHKSDQSSTSENPSYADNRNTKSDSFLKAPHGVIFAKKYSLRPRRKSILL